MVVVFIIFMSRVSGSLAGSQPARRLMSPLTQLAGTRIRVPTYTVFACIHTHECAVNGMCV